MSETNDSRAAREAAALGEELGRELGARTVLFHQAVADRLGISITDHKCLDIAQRASRTQTVTAGLLAEQTGLTTGAITGVLDRLEKAGFIRREKHPSDRRQVVVRLLDDRAGEFDEIFTPMQKAWEKYCREFDHDQLALIRQFVGGASRVLQEQTERLRREPPAAGARAGAGASVSADASVSSAPLGRIDEGLLELARGVANLSIGACDDDLLFRAHFERHPAKISVDGGRVTLTQKHGFMSFVTADPGDLRLSERIPWTVRVKGGAHKLDADLRRLHLAAFELVGGASESSVRLPEPSGTVSVRILGGISKLRLTPPADVPFRVVTKGGCSELVVDRLQLGAVGGVMRWESPDFATASDRYDFDIRGGASELTIVSG